MSTIPPGDAPWFPPDDRAVPIDLEILLGLRLHGLCLTTVGRLHIESLWAAVRRVGPEESDQPDLTPLVRRLEGHVERERASAR